MTEHERKDDTEGRIARLESRVAQQRARIDKLETFTARSGSITADEGRVNRRTALTAGGLLALAGVGVGTASADAQGQIGTVADPVQKIYLQELSGGVTGDEAVTDLSGEGLSIDNGSLSVGASNVGSGVGLFDTAASESLEFRSLVAGSNVTLTETIGEIAVDVPRPENVFVVAKSGGDHTSIQQAIDAATSPALVWVAPGTYTEEIETRDGVDLMGSGRNVTRIEGSITHNSGSATVSRLTIDGTEVVVEINGGSPLFEDITLMGTSHVVRTFGGETTFRNTRLEGDVRVIESFSFSLTIEASTIVGKNDVIDNQGGSVTIRRSSVVATGPPGSIAIFAFSPTRVANSKIVGATSGISNSVNNFDETYSPL